MTPAPLISAAAVLRLEACLAPGLLHNEGLSNSGSNVRCNYTAIVC